MTIRILVVDDDPNLRKSLRNWFERDGYIVSEAGSLDEARRELKKENYNLVTVDVNLHRSDGQNNQDGKILAREIRSAYDCGIVVISALDDQCERNSWLKSWADDAITKPFQVEELLARTCAVLRRYQAGPHHQRGLATIGRDIAKFAGWTLDLKRVELRSPLGKLVPLSIGDFDLLRILLRHPQQVVPRYRIAATNTSVQSMSSSDSARAVDMRISRLRDRLAEDQSGDKPLIRTVRGAGYMLAADVEWESDVRRSDEPGDGQL